VLTGGKVDAQGSVLVARLFRAAVERMFVVDDVVEHRSVHQYVEDRVVVVLVDQWPCLERLVEALLDHLHHHAIGVQCVEALAGRRYHRRVPVRLLSVRQHDVEQWLEHAALPHRRRVGARARDSALVGIFGRRVQRDEGQPGIEIETALPVCDRQFVRPLVGIDGVAWQSGLQDHVPGRQIDRRQVIGI